MGDTHKSPHTSPGGGGGVSGSHLSLDSYDEDESKGGPENLMKGGGGAPLAHPVNYLPGEVTLETAVDVKYMDPFGEPVIGNLEVTTFKLVFYVLRSEADISAYGGDSRYLLVQVPLTTIAEVREMGRSSEHLEYGIEIGCKDFRDLRFACKTESIGQPYLVDIIKKAAFPGINSGQLFAFVYGDKPQTGVFPENGWEVYKPEEEYHRQNIFTNGWRISKVNLTYKLSESYPALLAVPNTVLDDDMVHTSPHRSRGRVPVLSWLHPESKASITRCSQPMVGLQARRNYPDEDYVKKIRLANANANNLYIFDARPQVNALANREKGGGMENPGVYEWINYVFFNIQNTHVMRESQRKLHELCFPRPEESRWFYNLDQTKWLSHLRQILFAAASVADKVENNKTSVLVHCSDGWDWTPQITSLAMLMLDPYYRTIRGFEVLVEKEWCSFGHKFAQRLGHGENSSSSLAERSPVFLQFVDCVWQMTEQFGHAFEFNEAFLVGILDHLYSCQFGTFLFNSEQQRVMNQVSTRTHSLWSYVNASLDRYQNPLYTPAEVSGYRVLLPQCQMPQLRLWTGYYIRWNPALRRQEPIARQDKLLLEIMPRFHKLLASRRQHSMLGGGSGAVDGGVAPEQGKVKA